jgi:hypothetical protein
VADSPLTDVTEPPAIRASSSSKAASMRFRTSPSEPSSNSPIRAAALTAAGVSITVSPVTAALTARR